MRKHRGENNYDEAYLTESSTGSSSEDDTSMTVSEKKNRRWVFRFFTGR